MDIIPINRDTLRETQLQSPAKVEGLVWVRAFAALGVVLLHACVPYLKNPMPGLVWPVRDGTGIGIDFLFWAIEVVIMPVFLFVAGFLVWKSLERSTPKKILQTRARRLLLPFLFALLVILPFEPFIWATGFVVDGLVPIKKLRSLKFDGEIGEHFWGLAHLWFLPYLFLYVSVLAGGAAAVNRWKPARGILNRVMAAPATVPMLLIAIASMTLFFRPNVVWGFQHAFLPIPSKWIYSGCFFLGGVHLGAQDWQLSVLARNSRRIIPLAGLLLAASVILGRWHLSQSPDLKELQADASILLAVLTTSAAWVFTLAVMSLAVMVRTKAPKFIGYIAGASFWIYLLHHPLIGLVHIDLKWLFPSVSPVIKVAFAFTFVVGLCLVTYEVFIRNTRFGSWIGLSGGSGKRKCETPDDGTDKAILVRRAA